MTTTEYPFPVDELTKGSRVPADTVAQAFNTPRGSADFRMASLRAMDYIRRRFLDRGEVVTVVSDHDDLVILTDTDAAAYNANRFWIEVRSAARCHARALGVDRSKIGPAALAKHDRALEVQGRTLSAIRREQRLLPSPVQRSTPLPPGVRSKVSL